MIPLVPMGYRDLVRSQGAGLVRTIEKLRFLRISLRKCPFGLDGYRDLARSQGAGLVRTIKKLRFLRISLRKYPVGRSVEK
jgi:hypothetical protein